VDYYTTIDANLPTDQLLEGYLSARQVPSISIEVGMIDKTSPKKKHDYQAKSESN
jgi:hypothetical protein